ncbi:MAG: DUF1292 domain-containing protein [Oscillospiraceae bacterium]|nr:DUF1292 domain-containing protein [Oscillospiraceae bacterium]
MEDQIIITLTDEDGDEVDFELLDRFTYWKRDYVVLYPTAEDAEGVVIMTVENDENGDFQTFGGVESEKLLQAVFAEFQKRHPEYYENP